MLHRSWGSQVYAMVREDIAEDLESRSLVRGEVMTAAPTASGPGPGGIATIIGW
jgi:hypothetical protein